MIAKRLVEKIVAMVQQRGCKNIHCLMSGPAISVEVEKVARKNWKGKEEILYVTANCKVCGCQMRKRQPIVKDKVFMSGFAHLN